jgi:hypothetical protein
MSNFATYALAGILQSVGWPRKSGFLGRKVIVQAKVIDLAVEQLLKIGVTLGAGQPKAALRLIADSFDRDWTADSVRELVDFLNVDHLITANPERSPWQAIGLGFGEMGKEYIPWNWLGEPQLALHYTGWFTQALLWGILHAREARAALDADRRLLEERADLWKQQGLNISPDTWPSNNEEALRVCEELVSAFEVERRPLPKVSGALLEEPRIARALAQDH